MTTAEYGSACNIDCLNINGTHVTINNSTNNNISFFSNCLKIDATHEY